VVHEAFARLVDLELSWQDRAHFYCMAARTMRRVLVEHARKRHAAKRRGGLRVSLHDDRAVTPPPDVDILALDQALERLRQREERPSQVVELHYFAGLKLREIGEVLSVSRATVDRDLRFARAWLRHQLEES
jgi:RNA polymerase sigma factor (TIGR02999 family)